MMVREYSVIIKREMSLGCGEPRYSIPKRKEEQRRRVINKALKLIRALILVVRTVPAINTT
jgi:hypothetical protein